MNYYPYPSINAASSAPIPATVALLDNATAAFYSRYLLKRAMAALQFDIPEEWDKTYFLYTLFGFGFGAVLELPEYGIIWQHGTLAGRDLYYQPKRFLLTNPVLPNKELRVHDECVLVKLQPDYCGFSDIVATYANRLALSYEAWNMNTQNSKLAYVGFFENKAAANTFKAVFDSIQEGNPAAVTGRGLYDDQGRPRWGTFAQDLRANYIAPLISSDMRNIMNEFDSFVGIPNNPEWAKRERSVVDEVNSNNVETDTILDLSIRTIRDGFAEANEKYGLSLTVKKRYPLDLPGEDGGDDK